MVRISEVSFKIFKIARFYDFIPSKISGWLANPGVKRLKPIEDISQEELYACLYVFTHLRGFQEKFVYEIRTSGGHNVRFRRSAPLSKTFALMCTALTLLK